jgi:hypothetical protein
MLPLMGPSTSRKNARPRCCQSIWLRSPLLVLRGLAMRLSMPGGALLPSNDTPRVRDAFVTLRICPDGCRAGDTAAVARDGRGCGSDRERFVATLDFCVSPNQTSRGWPSD